MGRTEALGTDDSKFALEEIWTELKEVGGKSPMSILKQSFL